MMNHKKRGSTAAVLFVLLTHAVQQPGELLLPFAVQCITAAHTLLYSLCTFRNKIRFYGEELLGPRPNPMLDDHPLSAVRECLFNTFTATLHIGSCSSIRNLRMRHSMVTGTHLSWTGSSWLRIGTGGENL